VQISDCLTRIVLSEDPRAKEEGVPEGGDETRPEEIAMSRTVECILIQLGVARSRGADAGPEGNVTLLLLL
jgi:hypothetical protein